MSKISNDLIYKTYTIFRIVKSLLNDRTFNVVHLIFFILQPEGFYWSRLFTVYCVPPVVNLPFGYSIY